MKVVIELDTDNEHQVMQAYEMLFPLVLDVCGDTHTYKIVIPKVKQLSSQLVGEKEV